VPTTSKETVMTQYLLSVWDTHREGSEFGPYADEAEMQAAFEATGKFNEELQAKGSWVFGGGLHPPSTATVVDGTGEEVVTTDGPFSESKELIGGFWIIEAADLDEAMAIAAEGSKACRNPVEVRPFQGE
jgi:hypothetical protein